MLSKLSKVRSTNSLTQLFHILIQHIVIARQALAQEDVGGDFSNDFPETIPIDLKGNEGGCAC
jgi:hypothetical protein